MVGVVWYKDKDIGKNQLLKIKENYNLLGIKTTGINNGFACDNGDKWFGGDVNNTMLSMRYNVAYIQKGITENQVKYCVMPGCCLMPFSAYKYYG